MKIIGHAFLALVVVFYSVVTFAQPCLSYNIRGSVDVSRCRQINKKDLTVNIYVSVKEKGNTDRGKTLVPVLTDGSLQFKNFFVPRNDDIDSLINITGWTNNGDLVFVPLSIPSSSFNCKTGVFKIAPNLIIPVVINVRNCDPNELREMGKLSLGADPYKAISFYDIIIENGFDKSKEQKFNTYMALAAAYSNVGDFGNQSTTYSRLLDSVNINDLSSKYQLQFWKDYYGNQCNLLGFSNLRTKEQKIEFNRNFGNIVIKDEAAKQSWKDFLIAFNNAELGQLFDTRVTLAWDNATLITEQKKILSSMLNVKEEY